MSGCVASRRLGATWTSFDLSARHPCWRYVQLAQHYPIQIFIPLISTLANNLWLRRAPISDDPTSSPSFSNWAQRLPSKTEQDEYLAAQYLSFAERQPEWHHFKPLGSVPYEESRVFFTSSSRLHFSVSREALQCWKRSLPEQSVKEFLNVQDFSAI